MKKSTIIKGSLLVLLFILAITISGTIHYMSSKNKVESNEYSSSISERIYQLLPEAEKEKVQASYIDMIVRKLAHFTEYYLLALVLFMFFYVLTKRGWIAVWPSGVLSIGFAFFDEWYQRQSYGRTSSYFDVMIDSYGVLLSLVGALSLLGISRWMAKRK